MKEIKEIKETILELRKETGLNRKEFSRHFGIPLRTIEDWEAGRRTPPEYIPRLIKYQIEYEKLMGERIGDGTGKGHCIGVNEVKTGTKLVHD